MNSPTTPQIITALCHRDSNVLNKEGAINHNELARKCKMHQPTVTRILNGDSQSPSTPNIYKLAAYFQVTPGQLRGEDEIRGLFPKQKYTYFSTSHAI